MLTTARLRRSALLCGASLLLIGCGPLDRAPLASSGSFDGPTQPETVALTAPLAPLPKPAAPLASDFSYQDLLTGETKTMSVSRLRADAVRVRQSDGCVWTRWGDWFAPSDSWAACGESRNWSTGEARVRPSGSLWPLRVGAVARFDRDAVSHTGRSYSRETVCRVVDAVAVKREGHAATPAFVVDCSDGKRVRTTWYAPELGPIAFRKWHEQKGVEEAWVRL